MFSIASADIFLWFARIAMIEEHGKVVVLIPMLQVALTAGLTIPIKGYWIPIFKMLLETHRSNILPVELI